MGTMKIVSFSHHANNSGNALWNAECTKCNHTSVVQWNARTESGCKACHGRTQMSHIKYREGYASSPNLYMVKCGPYIKIGVTNDIDTRLKSIQSSCPYPITLVGYWEGEGHREKQWHEALAHLHHSGEWFKVGGACEI